MEARAYPGRGPPVVAQARRLRMATRARRSSIVPSTNESAASALRRGTNRTGMSRRSCFMATWNLMGAGADRRLHTSIGYRVSTTLLYDFNTDESDTLSSALECRLRVENRHMSRSNRVFHHCIKAAVIKIGLEFSQLLE